MSSFKEYERCRKLMIYQNSAVTKTKPTILSNVQTCVLSLMSVSENWNSFYILLFFMDFSAFLSLNKVSFPDINSPRIYGLKVAF